MRSRSLSAFLLVLLILICCFALLLSCAPAGTPAPTSAAPVNTAAPGAEAAETWTESVSGITFVRVPAGEFTMGSSEAQVDAALEMCNASLGNCERVWFEDETPQHQVTLGDYWIGQTEVTNAQFRAFVEDGGYSDQALWTEAGWQWRTDNSVTQPLDWDDQYRNQPDHPVVGVSWYEAVAYANWITRESGREIRLPSEAEWEKAACGTDGRTYPWGNEPPDAERANFLHNNVVGLPRTTPVGSLPAGASPYGTLDMAGNVWEWTASGFRDYPYDPGDGRENPAGSAHRTFRGGSFSPPDVFVRCAYRNLRNPVLNGIDVGFRVVSPGY